MSDSRSSIEDHDDEILARYRKQQRVTLTVIVLSLVMIVGLVVGFAVFVNANRPDSKEVQVPTYDAYRDAWESAMAKASVEATFPTQPVALADLEASGMHTFSATFTAEEISALLTMHPFEYEVDGGKVALQLPRVGFLAQDRADFDGYLVYGNTRYHARAEASATYGGGKITLDPADASLNVEGFNVGGDKRDQALAMVGNYMTALVAAAPRLTIESARVVEGGLEVQGIAPDSLDFPTLALPADSPAEATP